MDADGVLELWDSMLVEAFTRVEDVGTANGAGSELHNDMG